jgi:hypothetical protein
MGGENQVPQSAWNLLHLEVTIDGFHTFRFPLQCICYLSPIRQYIKRASWSNQIMFEGCSQTKIACHNVEFKKKNYQLRCALGMLISLDGPATLCS